MKCLALLSALATVALAASGCAGSHRASTPTTSGRTTSGSATAPSAAVPAVARVPNGVSEIDIHYFAPSRHVTNSPIHAHAVSRHVTNSSQVKSIIDWFDSLKPPGKTSYGCAGGPGENVTFTFRSANRAELAKAYSAAAAAAPCDPIQFTVRGQQETFLVDTNQKMGLINRVGRLLGTKFRTTVYYG